MTVIETYLQTAKRLDAKIKAITAAEAHLRRRRERAEEEYDAIVSAFRDELVRQPAKGTSPPFVPPVPHSVRSIARPEHVGARRRYMAAAIATVREILLATGRPMGAGEIHALHPEKSRLPLKALTKALDQRTDYAEPTFLAKGGLFWVPDRPLPAGWKHPKGMCWHVVPRRIRNARSGRA